MNYYLVLYEDQIKSMNVEQLLQEYADAYLHFHTTFKFDKDSCSEVMRDIQKEIEFRATS